jgi:hypothetical protein
LEFTDELYVIPASGELCLMGEMNDDGSFEHRVKNAK